MPITIHAPVEDVWKLFTPRGHHPYSKDFQALNFRFRALPVALRLRYVFGLLDVARLPSWGQRVLAPLDGKILHVSQDYDDHAQVNIIRDGIGRRLDVRCAGDDAGKHLGNHIIMAANSGHHLLFAHLKKSSVRVVSGQTVHAGEMLAQVGNSGASLLPHLHFHITDPSADNPDQPVPFVFAQHQTLDNGIWHDCQALLPNDHQPFRIRSNQ